MYLGFCKRREVDNFFFGQVKYMPQLTGFPVESSLSMQVVIPAIKFRLVWHYLVRPRKRYAMRCPLTADRTKNAHCSLLAIPSFGHCNLPVAALFQIQKACTPCQGASATPILSLLQFRRILAHGVGPIAVHDCCTLDAAHVQLVQRSACLWC